MLIYLDPHTLDENFLFSVGLCLKMGEVAFSSSSVSHESSQCELLLGAAQFDRIANHQLYWDNLLSGGRCVLLLHLLCTTNNVTSVTENVLLLSNTDSDYQASVYFGQT